MKVSTCWDQILERVVDNQNESGISMKSPLNETNVNCAFAQNQNIKSAKPVDEVVVLM